jgi:hypothetical protein
MAVRRKAFLEIEGFDEALRWATDWDCWIRMIFAGSRIGIVDEPLAEYRIRETGLASDRTRLIESRVALLEKAARRSDLSRTSGRSSTTPSKSSDSCSRCTTRARRSSIRGPEHAASL